ncbi:phosphorylase family protein [Streptomyces chattanoogensis]
MVVLTALQVEYEAVRQHLEDVREVELPQGTLLDVGRIPGLNWDVALAETGPTNTRAALVTQPAIEYFDAEAVFFVGVAGALKDHLRLGDVVVASKVYGYQGGRESVDGFAARPDAWRPSYDMDQLVRSACRNKPWAFLAQEPQPATPPRVHFEPIASGDVLIGSRDSETARRIRHHYNDAVAADMESQGVAHAAGMHRTVRMLSIRGISDFAGPDKAVSDAAGSQETASRHAAAFALRVLRDLRPSGRPAQERLQQPSVVVVSGPGPDRDTGPAAWDSRPVIRVGEREYLLYGGPGDLLHESRDGDVVWRQAVARVVSDRKSRGSYAWLRQVECAQPLAGPGFDPLASLEEEARMCRALRGPDVLQWDRRRNSATLALAWPADAKFGRPLQTLHELLPEPPAPTDPLRLWSIVKGLAEVAEVLDRLSGEGLSHRALRPTSVVMNRPHMVLRDFGLAAVPPRLGENPGPYQAPEQRYGSGIRPGAATDVYQLGALLHRALTGRTPVPGLPAYRPSASVPAGLGHAVSGALQQDPADRPGVRTLRLALLAAVRELSSVPPPQR